MKIKDIIGLCWDFAATKSTETFLQLTQDKKYDLSEMHVNYVESNLLLGFRKVNTGGNFSIYEDYLTDYGPVLEADAEYRDFNEDEYSKFLGLKNITTVTKTVNFPTIFKYNNYEETVIDESKINVVRNAVKNHIMNYGSVYAQIAMSDYNWSTNTLYSNPDKFSSINHAISIIGWDDDYSRENFPENNRPEKDGAYIALNSWGEGFGKNGLFYISYEDQNVESGMSGIASTSFKEAYEIDKITNSVFKDIVLQRLSNTFKENNGKKYVTSIALSRILDIDLKNTYVQNLKGIDIFEKLYNVDISKTTITDITPLKDLKELSSLNISNTSISDISILKEIKELTYLNISDTKVKDVSALSDNDLWVLNVSNNSDIKGYEKIKSLQELVAVNCNIKDVSNLEDLKWLYILDLSENPNIENISELKNNLNSLILSKCNLKTIENLSSIESLEVLDISYNNLTDINGIEKFNGLYGINLSGNNIKDFSSISKITGHLDEEFGEQSFIDLTVEDCKINDISIFNNLKNVSILNLSNNNITNLSAFYNNSIHSLDLSENHNLNNIQYLKNLENLYALYFRDCNIDDLSEISKLGANLAVLDLSKNNITDVSKLNNLKLELLSLAENENIEGKLNIDTLRCLDVKNLESYNGNFRFNNCKNLLTIDLSGFSDSIIREILSNDEFKDLSSIYLENTLISRETLQKIQEKDIYLGGGDINIKQVDEDAELIKDNTVNLKKLEEIRKEILPSVRMAEVYITGGTLSKDINTININNGAARVSIKIGNFGLNINIELKQEKTVNMTSTGNNVKDETKTNTNTTTKNNKTNTITNSITKDNTIDNNGLDI